MAPPPCRGRSPTSRRAGDPAAESLLGTANLGTTTLCTIKQISPSCQSPSLASRCLCVRGLIRDIRAWARPKFVFPGPLPRNTPRPSFHVCQVCVGLCFRAAPGLCSKEALACVLDPHPKRALPGNQGRLFRGCGASLRLGGSRSRGWSSGNRSSESQSSESRSSEGLRIGTARDGLESVCGSTGWIPCIFVAEAARRRRLLAAVGHGAQSGEVRCRLAASNGSVRCSHNLREGLASSLLAQPPSEGARASKPGPARDEPAFPRPNPAGVAFPWPRIREARPTAAPPSPAPPDSGNAV
jgi:hypothetical protein